MTWPAVKQAFVQDDFRRYVAGLSWSSWRPSKIVWHNTAAPTLAQWIKSADADRAAGRVPGTTRIQNLENFFRFDNHWSGCPHLFIANDFIWVMNPLTAPGVHSPSWNGTSIGIEMVGDFDREDDDAGEGLKVKQNTIFATAILCSALGLEPGSGSVDRATGKTTGTIFLHKQDPKTTHDCPGKNIAQDKAQMIADVVDLMGGGEHDPHADVEAAPKPAAERHGITTIGDLSFRRGPGVNNESTGSLAKGVSLAVLAEAQNGSSTWLQVRTPAGHIGWVSGRYVTIS